jgi:hypothetical protein
MSAREIVEELKMRCGIGDRLAWSLLQAWEKKHGGMRDCQQLNALVAQAKRSL